MFIYNDGNHYTIYIYIYIYLELIVIVIWNGLSMFTLAINKLEKYVSLQLIQKKYDFISINLITCVSIDTTKSFFLISGMVSVLNCRMNLKDNIL